MTARMSQTPDRDGPLVDRLGFSETATEIVLLTQEIQGHAEFRIGHAG